MAAAWTYRATVKSCLGKTRWTTEKAARWALQSLRRENPGAFDSTVRPYRCPHGGRPHWHLGHSL